MIVLDVNVLIGAFFQAHPNHGPAAALLRRAMTELGPVIVPDVVWSGFIRIATGAPLFRTPATWSQVKQFVQDIQVHTAGLEIRGLKGPMLGLIDLAERAGATGNLVSDAYIAAVALENGCPVATFDRDFTRFPGLVVVNQ
jgi:toxin-antitoxin system PIN domain toxin